MPSSSDLKIYKDGKVVAIGAGPALYQSTSTKSNRFTEGKSVSNMNALNFQQMHKKSV